MCPRGGRKEESKDYVSGRRQGLIISSRGVAPGSYNPETLCVLWLSLDIVATGTASNLGLAER